MALDKMLLLSGVNGAGTISAASALIQARAFRTVGTSGCPILQVPRSDLAGGDEQNLQRQVLRDHPNCETDRCWIVDRGRVQVIVNAPRIANRLADAVTGNTSVSIIFRVNWVRTSDTYHRRQPTAPCDPAICAPMQMVTGTTIFSCPNRYSI